MKKHAGTLVLISGSDPSTGIGGHSSYVRVHALAALRAGYVPHIFCVGPETAEFHTDFGVVHRIRSPYRPYRNVMLHAHAPRLIRSIEKFLLSGEGPHLLHGFSAWSCVGSAVAKRLEKRKIAAIAIASCYDTLLNTARAKRAGTDRVHGFRRRLSGELEFLWKRFILDRYERCGYVSAKLVLVNYDSVRRILLSSYGNALESNIRVTPYTTGSAFTGNAPGILPELPEAISRLEHRQAPLLVSVSRHDPRKGVNIFLHALARLRDGGTQFRACLVGGGPLLATHRQLAARLDLEASVAIPGFVPDPSVYLRHADIFVLPSLEEGSGSLSLIEALQAGAAIVASDIDGIPEDVTHNHDALSIRPDDVEELAKALHRLITDSDLRERLARRGKETFGRRFSADGFATALAGIYSEVLETV